MANPVEIVSGLAPAVHCFLVFNGKKRYPLQAAHPFVPTIHVAVKEGRFWKFDQSYTVFLK